MFQPDDIDLLVFKCQAPLKELEDEATLNNPWDVTDASVFLQYCCPECDHRSKNLELFSDHALGNHPKSIKLFDKVDRPTKVHKNMVDFLENIDIPEDEQSLKQLTETIFEDNSIRKEHQKSVAEFEKFAAHIVNNEVKSKKSNKDYVKTVLSNDEKEFYKKLSNYMEDDSEMAPPVLNSSKKVIVTPSNFIKVKPSEVLFDAELHAINQPPDLDPEVDNDQVGQDQEQDEGLEDHIPYIHNVIELNPHGAENDLLQSAMDSAMGNTDSSPITTFKINTAKQCFDCYLCDKSFKYKFDIIHHWLECHNLDRLVNHSVKIQNFSVT